MSRLKPTLFSMMTLVVCGMATCTGAIALLVTALASTGILACTGEIASSGGTGVTGTTGSRNGDGVGVPRGAGASQGASSAATPASPGGQGSPGAVGPGVSGGAPLATTAAPGRIRRLTAREFNNSLQDILGDVGNGSNAFPADGSGTGFDNDFESLSVTELFANHLQTISEAAAAAAVTRIGTLLPCANARPLDEKTCATQFIETYGKKLFRRPASTDEKTRLLGLFATARALTDFPGSLRTVTEAMLQSPNFLYRTELGAVQAGKRVRLTSYELAAELSYFVWASAPDDELLAAAEAGRLDDTAEWSAQVGRLIKDAKAIRAVTAFFLQWLQIDNARALQKNAGKYPNFNDRVLPSLLGETRAFIDDVFSKGDASLSTFLTSTRSFANGDVSATYGLMGGPAGTSYAPVNLDVRQRAGVLTHPSVIAAHTHEQDISPVLWGKFVRESIFCQALPPPPAAAPPLRAPTPNTSTRERYSQHRSDAACSGCHQLMDPIGYGFEQFDPIGRFQAVEQGKFPLSGAGELTGTDVDGPFTGAVELSRRLVGSQQMRQCFADTLFKFAMGRKVNPANDANSVKSAFDRFQQSNLSVRELLASVATSESFLYRQQP